MRLGCFTFVLLLVFLLCFVGCQTAEETPEVIALTDPWGEEWTLEMTLENVTPAGATVVFTHSGDGVFLMTGLPYELEMFVDGQWAAVEPQNELIFHLTGYTIPNNERYEMETDWEYHYGELPEGRYRIGKSVRIEGRRTNEYEGIQRIENYTEDVMYYAEFTI